MIDTMDYLKTSTLSNDFEKITLTKSVKKRPTLSFQPVVPAFKDKKCITCTKTITGNRFVPRCCLIQFCGKCFRTTKNCVKCNRKLRYLVI